MCDVAPVTVCHQNALNIISWGPSVSPVWLLLSVSIPFCGFLWCGGHCRSRCCHGSLWWLYRMWWCAPEDCFHSGLCVELVWHCLFFSRCRDSCRWNGGRACLSCFKWGLFFSQSIFFWSPLCPRDLFRIQVRRSQSHGFKARVGSYAFFVDFPVSGVVRAKPQKVKLWCNVKLLDGMPPRPSQWNFLLEN